MRIAYLLSSLGIGGAEKQVIDIAERLDRRGHTVLLLVLLPPQSEQWKTDLPVIHLNMTKSPSGAIGAFARAGQTLRTFAPEILHSHTFHANMTARLLRLTRATPRSISTIHNVYEGGWPRMLAYRLTDPLALHTTAVSQAAADRFVRLRAVPRRKVSVIANAVDASAFAPDAESRARLRAELDAGDDFIFLAAGRETPAKDLPNLLRAFSQVRLHQPNTQLWLAGPQSASSCRGNQAGFASSRETLQGVRRLGLRRDMSALFNAADAFVLSSAWEGMPLVVAEAMATAKPVIATDVGGVRELLGGTGSIVPPRDSSALAMGMQTLLYDSMAHFQEIGRAARLRILGNFDIETRAAQWESFYRQWIAQGSSHESKVV
jgi:glycosyltransferase involved in cell wall biosynthesis